MEVVWCVLRVEGLSFFGMGIEGCREPGEGGVHLVGAGAWEGDVFRGDDPMVDGHVFWDVVGWETSGDLGGDWESGNSEGQGLVSSSVVEAGSLKGRLTDLRYRWICSFLTGD